MRNSLNDDFLLREEKPIVLDDYSLPIPDISLVKQRPDDPYFVGSHPKASEVSMVIEISDSSYLRDRNVKLAAYAQASIAEYWIVNVKKKLSGSVVQNRKHLNIQRLVFLRPTS